MGPLDGKFILILNLILDAFCQNHGPVFLLEPPSVLSFSNTSGSQVSCSAHGSPAPTVEWLDHNGQTVVGVPGLRQSLGNGTLYFPPFRSQDYRRDIHFTVYRCRASNLAGTILSRDVNVKAVVNQQYDVHVYHSHVLEGNTAVLSCVIPSYVKDFVSVTSWSRDDTVLLPGSNMGGRILVTYGSGELHIRSVRQEDGLPRYSCITLHMLTQERKISPPALLTVTEPTGSMPPQISLGLQTNIVGDFESMIHLSCAAQAHPPPTFSWLREINGELSEIHSSQRIQSLQDVLFIKRLEPSDAGRWVCKASNLFGEQSLNLHLSVTSHLSVHIFPQTQVVNSGETAVFNCSVTGVPVGDVYWTKDGKILNPDKSRLKLLGRFVLVISYVTRLDRGMYQCFVRNDRENAQGSGELRLGDTIPELQYTFTEQSLHPGPLVSLKCSATGSPPPHFKWYLDGEILSGHSLSHRHAIGQYVDQEGDVVSHLNITNVKPEDGGLYSCRAMNSLGYAEHASRLNVNGPPFIRTIAPVRAVAGSDIILRCPYSGYPIDSVKWERLNQQLPSDIRHRLDKDGALTISRLDPVADAGSYTCTVTSQDGEARKDIQLVVSSPPKLEPFHFPANLQEGGRVQVTCFVSSGDLPITFVWRKDGIVLNKRAFEFLNMEERKEDFFSMLVISKITSKHSGEYTCGASNAAAEANFTAKLTVKVAPKWTVEPQDASVLVGKSALIDCDAKGYPKPQITWLKGLGEGATDYQPVVNSVGRTTLLSNGSLWFESTTPEDEGNYLCRATNGIGSGLSKVVYLGINEPVRFTNSPKNISVKRGESTSLLCQVYGDTPIKVAWVYKGNRFDSNNHKYSVIKTNLEKGLKSELKIEFTDRSDSGSYICEAENEYGKSEYVITLMVQEKPDPPINLEAVEVASRSIRLSWQRPYDGNSPILGYELQFQPLISGKQWDQAESLNISHQLYSISNDLTGKSFETTVVDNLLPATAYRMRMQTINGIDKSLFTEFIIVKTQEEVPSDAPKNVNVESMEPSELLISWQIPPRENWNGDLRGYILSWNEQGKPINETKTLTVKGWATTKALIKDLKKFTRYNINVRAFNAMGSGPPSINVVGTTKEGVPEAPPQDISCSQITSQSIRLSWSPPPFPHHGGVIKGYKIYYRPVVSKEGDVSNIGEVKKVSSTETHLHGLYKFTNYSIQVLAFTNAGDGVVSSTLTCSTEEDVPGPPADVKAAALTAESIIISWLKPINPNGRISHYTIYSRQSGMIGKYNTYTVRNEDIRKNQGLMYEVRKLIEKQLYEFWVSATTSIGEGEPTAIVTRAPTSRAPARIASFSQVISKPVKNNLMLPCAAVGNPTPRSWWVHEGKSITFSPYFEVTEDGNLFIHSIENHSAGNYTCKAKNLFGEDEITYTLSVLYPPGPPKVELQYTTKNSIRIHWTPGEDGGAAIQGYIIKLRKETNELIETEVTPEILVHTIENLKCGTNFQIQITARNKVGEGKPSQILSVSTKGGSPLSPEESDILTTNTTAAQLNLFNWPDNGCPITHVSVQYRKIDEKEWRLVSSSVSNDRIVIDKLAPSTWYDLKMVAFNDAGSSEVTLKFATNSVTGEAPPPLIYYDESLPSNGFENTELYIILPSVLASVVILIGVIWVILFRRKEKNKSNSDQQQNTEEKSDHDNKKNCQQIYTSSPMKKSEGVMQSEAFYEISPYATFSVGGPNIRPGNNTLDYDTRHFKTFGRMEPETLYLREGRRIKSGKRQEAREQKSSDLRGSESEGTSGSPSLDCPRPPYQVPVKFPPDMFKPDSSTESNDPSPIAERRHQTPRHIIGTNSRRQHNQYRPPSSSSSEKEEDREERSPYTQNKSKTSISLHLQPPYEFSDSQEFSEAECDREIFNKTSINEIVISQELSNLLSKYYERKEQEKREFVIHV